MRLVRTAVLIVLGLAALPLAQEKQRYPRPEPKFKVRVDRSVMIPMRDGVRLSTDLYFPEGAGDKLPVILIRTPYNKSVAWVTPAAEMFAGQGYIVALQDVRSRFESEGKDFLMNAAEPKDGYDTIDWLTKQPWSTGRIGTYGCSYLGEVQYGQAPLKHPNLTAMLPQGAGPVKYHNFGVMTGGALELVTAFGWFRDYGSSVYPKLPADLPHDTYAQAAKYFSLNPVLPKISHRALWKTLPIIDMLDKAGAPPSHWSDIVDHEAGDVWWEKLGLVKPTDTFDVPALHVNSWYDWGAMETLQLFNQFRTNGVSARARDNQFAIISPTAHCSSETTTEHTIVGARPMGDAQFAYWTTYLHWFDHWLRDADNDITSMPHLQYYLMGKNEWRSAQEWPVAGTNFTDFYLHSSGRANSRMCDGTLSALAAQSEPDDKYTYDPASPVPSLGGPQCCTGTDDAPEGAFDQADVEMRNDVLVYTSAPLQEGIEVTGPIKLVLFVSSSVRDTDFTAKLVDVYPDGTAYNVQEGVIRARYREGMEKKVWMEAGKTYKVEMTIGATANYFGTGHRIRVEISSSNFPRFDRNMNTGGKNYDESKWIVAENQLHHSQQYPSRVILPIVPAEDRKGGLTSTQGTVALTARSQ